MVIAFQPEDKSQSLEIPAFSCEIIGSKHMRSSDTTMRHALIGMLETLAFMQIAYRLKIKHQIINIYTMMRNGKYECRYSDERVFTG